MNVTIERIIKSLSFYIHGKEKALRLALLTFFSKGHLLIEDLPGLGKTTLAIAIAKCLGLSFGRIQCTSDLLPTDITGVSVYEKNLGSFTFHPGPIFNNIVLCDEINRAPPKTQSALLEAMEERQVTVDGKTHRLPRLFCVIATQNPIEQFGTFPLPDSQLDRFTVRLSIGYPDERSEKEILRVGGKREELLSIEPTISEDEVYAIQEEIEKGIYVSEKILEYVLRIVKATRNHEFIKVGLSTRGALTIVQTAKANAFFHGRDFVIPEDICELAEYVIPHRLIFKERYEGINRKEFIKSLLAEIPLPL
ncbi:MAG: MoxR family ATPase [Desulfobacterota bacterium]|nr:MoxR family ATPase [Thermodesulfobacteriota bacterium]MDW8001328.1 MoxR family ATPase [Deltaproteobacteria bacterium]